MTSADSFLGRSANPGESSTLADRTAYLFWFIREREQIRRRRQLGKPWPWTSHEILRKWRYCCIRRRDDRVSQWLLREWYEPRIDHANTVVACVLARLVNNTEALAVVGYPEEWDPDHVEAVLRKREAARLTVWSRAYRAAIPPEKGCSRITYAVHGICDPIYSDLQAGRLRPDTTSVAAHKT